jgi:sulfatase modifying factor 1
VRRLALIGSGAALALVGATVMLYGFNAPERHDAPTAPPGMVYVPGGLTHIGADDGAPTERPVFTARVLPFYMDVAPITVAQFREFVRGTGYVTQAERLGDAGVLDLRTGSWSLVAGATWQHPLGPAGPAAPDDHPVTQVSWHDATAYANWAGKRLPTEIEWEHAARGGRNAREQYPWGEGSARRADGGHRANIGQGRFTASDGAADGYHLTSPVGMFGANALGLTDLGGNVWEWTGSWFRSYAELARQFTPSAASERVQRGGSFLCHEDFCHGYRVSARAHSTPETALFHVGFRLVMDITRP